MHNGQFLGGFNPKSSQPPGDPPHGGSGGIRRFLRFGRGLDSGTIRPGTEPRIAAWLGLIASDAPDFQRFSAFPSRQTRARTWSESMPANPSDASFDSVLGVERNPRFTEPRTVLATVFGSLRVVQGEGGHWVSGFQRSHDLLEDFINNTEHVTFIRNPVSRNSQRVTPQKIRRHKNTNAREAGFPTHR